MDILCVYCNYLRCKQAKLVFPIDTFSLRYEKFLHSTMFQFIYYLVIFINDQSRQLVFVLLIESNVNNTVGRSKNMHTAEYNYPNM